MSEDLAAWLRQQIEADSEAWAPPSLEHVNRALGEARWTVNDARWVRLHAVPMLDADREMKLAILDEHATKAEPGGWGVPELLEYWCQTCDVPRGQPARSWCRTVRLLASGYRDRPGYREEWKP